MQHLVALAHEGLPLALAIAHNAEQALARRAAALVLRRARRRRRRGRPLRVRLVALSAVRLWWLRLQSCMTGLSYHQMVSPCILTQGDACSPKAASDWTTIMTCIQAPARRPNKLCSSELETFRREIC